MYCILDATPDEDIQTFVHSLFIERENENSEEHYPERTGPRGQHSSTIVSNNTADRTTRSPSPPPL